MIRALLIGLIFAIPGLVSAQQISVRSGEHGAFTRLVFYIPAGTEWQINRAEQAQVWKLDLDLKDARFDLTDVFRRIDKNRLQSIRPLPDEAAVSLVLGCDCEPVAFVLRDNMLVLDLYEGSTKRVPVARSKPLPAKSTDLSDYWLGQSIGLNQNAPKMPLNVVELDTLQPQEKPKPVTVEAAQELRTIEVRNQVIGDVASAAAQGLLEPSPNPKPLVEAAGTDPQTAAEVLPNTNDVSAELEHRFAKKGHVAIGPRVCASDRVLNFPQWGEPGTDVGLSLAMRRGAIFGEFDKVSEEAVEGYVKSLLYYGFGAEARTVLNTIDRDRFPELFSLSYLVDGEEDPSGFFDFQANCEGRAALWSALDGSGLNNKTDLKPDDLVLSFEMLPKHLREHLGPQLAENLALASFKSEARDILSRLERAVGDDSLSVLLGQARLDQLEGRSEEAKEALQPLTIVQTPETPKAIAATVEIAKNNGDPIPERIVELTAAYSTELRNTEAGSELWQAHVRSLIVNNRYDDALDLLNSVEGVPEDLVKQTVNETFASIFKNSDDPAFLNFFFGEVQHYKAEIKESHRLAAANRMLDLGFPGAALEMLNGLVDARYRRERKLAQAKALLQLDRASEADILLIGLTGDDVVRLRARARSDMGDHEFARALYAELGQSPDELHHAWLSGNWENVAEHTESPLSQAANLLQDNTEVDASEDVSLRGANSLFDASGETRLAIRNLLDATQLPQAN